MKESITITSKGQTTLPVQIRRKLGVSDSGGVLQIKFDESKNQLIISKATDINELSQQLTSYIKPGTIPLEDVDALYAKRPLKIICEDNHG